MKLARFGLVPLLTTAFIAAFGISMRAADKPAVPQRIVLDTFKAEPQGGLQYELSIAPCREAGCAFEVRLLNGPSVLATLDLGWMKAHQPVVRDHGDESSGVGDPLEVPKKIMAWSTGEEKDNVSTIARVVRLAPRVTGLLIDQQAGFDVVKRRHVLVVAMNKKLVRAWADQEGPGPTWSTVVVADSGPNEPQEILVFDGFRQPSDDLPDKLRFGAYQWDANENKLDSAVRGTPTLYAVTAGEFKTAAEAHAAVMQSDCLSGFWVLKSDALLKLEPGRFVVAAVSTKKAVAVEKSEAVKACAPKLSVSIIETLYSPFE